MTGLTTDPRLVAILVALLLTYCRVQACILALPGFSFSGLPARLRVAVAMSVTPLLAETTGLTIYPETIAGFAIMCAAEVVTGLALGMMVRLFAMALDIAGAAIAATSSLSQMIGVATEHSPHPVGNLLHLAGLALLMALGFPVAVCVLLRDSLVLRPVGAWPQIADLFPTAIDMVRHGFVLALLLAAPVVLGGYLFQLLSGMISKVMPALPVMFIASPGAILLALLALVLLGPPTIGIWAGAVMDMMRDALP